MVGKVIETGLMAPVFNAVLNFKFCYMLNHCIYKVML